MNLNIVDEYENHLVGNIPSVSSARQSNIMMVAIAGGSGSGKTSLADAVYKAVGEKNVTFISHDSYYRDNRYNNTILCLHFKIL